jgi:hypothetical protein
MAETHMWTAPSPQGVLQRFDQIVASTQSARTKMSPMSSELRWSAMAAA